MMAIRIPLDRQATAEADAEFYKKFPHMVDSTGRPIALDPENPNHDAMRAEWLNLYEAALDSDARAGAGTPPEKQSDYHDVPGPENPPEKTCQDCAAAGKDAPPDEPSVRIRISVFFDGTNNSQFNEREADATAEASGGIADGESNVSKLETATRDAAQGYDHYKPIYVEGIGTLDGRSDSSLEGGATGQGLRGIDAKVLSGIVNVLRAVDEFGVGGKPVSRFTLDAVGFSRGAAAARHFIWRMFHDAGSTLDERLASKLNMKCSVDAKFLGLFDTVSSYGLNHTDDVKELNLDKIEKVDTVFQLCAAEEHRKNFRLTTTKKSKGTDIYIPGVHSDVGGGYKNGGNEINWQLIDIDVPWVGDKERKMFDREKNWFLDRGWVNEDDYKEWRENFWNELKWTRLKITNYYSRIPLQIMRERAESSGIPMAATIIDDGRCTIESITDPQHKSTLNRANNEIRAALFTKKCASYSYWMNNKESWHKALRNKHLHQSARYGEVAWAHEPNWDNGDPVTGRRERGVNHG